ncbi:MAG: lipopolysaccharide transport periplasmic protein LptA [Pseudomonadota bacterium]
MIARIRPATGAMHRLLALGCLLLPVTAVAQPPASDAPPVEITADRAEVDERQGISTYHGEVVVTRGEMTLRGDTLVIHTRERRPHTLEAHGDPARLEAPDPETGAPRIATAAQIDYLLDDERVILIGTARVQTPTEDARAERITYDLRNDSIRAERGEDEDQRVRITIQPGEE